MEKPQLPPGLKVILGNAANGMRIHLFLCGCNHFFLSVLMLGLNDELLTFPLAYLPNDWMIRGVD